VPTTPLDTRHKRGTTLVLEGWVKQGGERKVDLPSDTIRITVSDMDSWTPVAQLTLTSGDPAIVQNDDGSWKATIDGALTRRNVLPKDEYYIEAFCTDHTTGKPWCVGEGKLILTPSGQG
jgi:hypothetical protein